MTVFLEMQTQLFNRASKDIQNRFGGRLQKIPIDAGFTCPNLDGTLSYEGCTYCNRNSFVPFYANKDTNFLQQLERGIDYFSQRYSCKAFLAYLQTGSCTYISDKKLEELLNNIFSHAKIAGVSIATRPDCIDNDKLKLLINCSKGKHLRLEIGVESFCSKALAAAGRHHSAQQSLKALELASKKNIETCAHIILGLPEESKKSQIEGAKIISETSTKYVKLHHLQIVKGSKLALKYLSGDKNISPMTKCSYIELVSEFISHLSPTIYIERLLNRVPPSLLIAPIWTKTNESLFQKELEKYMIQHNLYQGCKLFKRSETSKTDVC